MVALSDSAAALNAIDVLDTQRELVRNASIELSPRQLGSMGPLTDYLPSGTRVYIPSIPGVAWRETLAACERLAAEGMPPVPHLPARLMKSAAQLDDRLGRLADAGVGELLLVAGDHKRAAGPYRDTVDVLESGKLVEHGFRRLGVTAYPEGHPLATHRELEAALSRKTAYANATDTDMWIVTQFTFAAAPAVAWLTAMRDRGCPLPVYIGLPGPARLRTLLAYAARCGVRASARALTRQPSVIRLLKRWSPDDLLRGLAQYRAASPGTNLAGIHLFTFGGLPRTSRWLRVNGSAARRVASSRATAAATTHSVPEACDGLRPIIPLAEARLGINADQLVPYGHYKAKLSLPASGDASTRDGKLVLVTAISPTAAGEGKTTTSIGLSDALNRLGVRATVCLREPSLGPCFGMKGGATGGGRARVAPETDINLHFNGDMHAVSTANNLLAAVLDSHVYWNNALDIDPETISWRRVLDLNDRALRDVELNLGRGAHRSGGFDITAASEVMAVLCLARDRADLERRLGRIVVARKRDGEPVVARDLGVDGAMAALLTDALRPNVVQSLEGNVAFIHGGPFANIAHGCNSVIATRAALAVSDVVVTEAGFGADLGAEKFLDIKCRQSGLRPDAAVLVCTVRALKLHGGVEQRDLTKPDVSAVRNGAPNLARHIANLTGFGLKPVIAINRFDTDTEEEIAAIRAIANDHGVEAVVATHWQHGGAGATALARAVLDKIEEAPAAVELLYPDEIPLRDKIEAVATRLYGASGVSVSATAAAQLDAFETLGHGHLPVCIAKTQYSFSADPKARGAPEGHVLPVREARLAAGAGFVVVICGDIMTMPGLPRRPAALDVGVDARGRVTGL